MHDLLVCLNLSDDNCPFPLVHLAHLCNDSNRFAASQFSRVVYFSLLHSYWSHLAIWLCFVYLLNGALLSHYINLYILITHCLAFLAPLLVTWLSFLLLKVCAISVLYHSVSIGSPLCPILNDESAPIILLSHLRVVYILVLDLT